MELIIDDMQDGYVRVCKMVAEIGDRVAPRGIHTREMLNATIILTDPTRALPVGVGRKANTQIAAVEALQLMGGVLHTQRLLEASLTFSQFMDAGTFHGGYGQRTRAQLPIIVDRLMGDPSTRRAVMTMWDPLHDLFIDDAKDYPCTIALQFLVRGEELQLHTHMRSNDVWRGLAYDVFVFTQLQLAMAAMIGKSCGPYYHHTTSLHMYETDLGGLQELHTADRAYAMGGLFRNVPGPAYVQKVARTFLEHKTVEPHVCLDATVAAWYASRFPSKASEV